MSDELAVPPPLISHQAEKPVTVWVDPSLQGQPPPALTPEQTRAIDALYAQQTKEEPSAMAALFGIWAGGVLLTDLAGDHFHLPPEKKQVPRLPPELEEGE